MALAAFYLSRQRFNDFTNRYPIYAQQLIYIYTLFYHTLDDKKARIASLIELLA
jgi:hypothetical protein